ncbi:MAG: GntR family transcriptional regulator [Desulfobacula sp.]|jgi:DNA-binding GntR family transcriptional regulator
MERKSLKEKVYKALRHDILTGKMPGGTHTTESGIAKSLNVSRTPVKEALLRLTQEKLITSLPRAGYIIETLSDEDIRDLFTVRFEIEALAVRKAARFVTGDELKMMGDNIDKAKTCIKSGELQKMTELDLEFHTILYKASRSKTYYRICKNLGDLTVKYRHGLNLVRDLWKEAIENHTIIYQALLAKDEEKAVQAITDHGKQAIAQLLDIMKKIRSDSFFEEEI